MTDVQRREDALLDKISQLAHTRDAIIERIDMWREALPDMKEVMDDLELVARS